MKHILIYGERGTGKSTLIARLLDELNIPVYGYVTKRLDSEENGFHPIYIHQAQEYYHTARLAGGEISGPRGAKLEGLEYSERNLLGTCNGKIHETNTEVFNGIGAGFITEGLCASGPGVIVMDEIGFLESRAEVFRDRILEALDGKRPVIASVKARPDVEFIRRIIAHENAEVYELTKENREEIYRQLKGVLK